MGLRMGGQVCLVFPRFGENCRYPPPPPGGGGVSSLQWVGGLLSLVDRQSCSWAEALMKENGNHHQAHLRPSARKWMMSKVWNQCICCSLGVKGTGICLEWCGAPIPYYSSRAFLLSMSMGNIGGRSSSVTPLAPHVSGRWVNGSEGWWVGQPKSCGGGGNLTPCPSPQHH